MEALGRETRAPTARRQPSEQLSTQATMASIRRRTNLGKHQPWPVRELLMTPLPKPIQEVDSLGYRVRYVPRETIGKHVACYPVTTSSTMAGS